LGVLDDGQILWAATLEMLRMAWDGTRWLAPDAIRFPPHIYMAVADGPGQMWMGTMEGELIFYDQARITRHDIKQLGFGAGIFPGQPLTVGGERGLGVLKDGAITLLQAADPGVLRNVSGMITDAAGDRWLNGAAGVLHVRAADWARAMATPAAPLVYTLFDASDGYPGQAAISNRKPSAVSPDGRHLWFAGTGGVVSLDTAALRRNRVAPVPQIQRVVTDSASFAARSPLRLPPGSQQLRLDFTAPALRAPERLRFQYRLDGVDPGWQDAGTRRMTMYTSVAPGDYTFRLRAVNEDGVASAGEAVLQLAVAPTVLQGLPFRLACGALLLLLAAALYRYRVGLLTTRLMERMVVRIAERERIARLLHDTILQTVQALVLRLDAVVLSLPSGDRTRHQLETLVGRATAAVNEGRDQLHELRAASPQALEDIVAGAIGGQRELYPGLEMVLRIDGASRALHAGATDEAGYIACEALRNACAHAQATRIVIRLAYGRRALTVCVRDDGRGLDRQVARDGYRSGHWGMIGMRERAARLGARLSLDSGAGKGTTVTLAIPARRAYAGN
jgi:signal transduction histidine kinase